MNGPDVNLELTEDIDDEDELNSDIAEEFFNFAGAILTLDNEEAILEACKTNSNVHLLTMALRLRNSMALEDLGAAIREASGSAVSFAESPAESEEETEESSSSEAEVSAEESELSPDAS